MLNIENQDVWTNEEYKIIDLGFVFPRPPKLAKILFTNKKKIIGNNLNILKINIVGIFCQIIIISKKKLVCAWGKIFFIQPQKGKIPNLNKITK